MSLELLLPVMLQLKVFMVLPQRVVLSGEWEVSCLQVLHQALAVVEPVIREEKHPSPLKWKSNQHWNKSEHAKISSTIRSRWKNIGCPQFWPVQQGVIGSFQGLVLLRITLQPGVVLKKLLHVCLGALHLQHLAAQLRLQTLVAALHLLQQGAQLTGLREQTGGASEKEYCCRRNYLVWRLPQLLLEHAGGGTERWDDRPARGPSPSPPTDPAARSPSPGRKHQPKKTPTVKTQPSTFL